MRSKRELWKVVDEYFDKYFYEDLCGVICRLYHNGIITLDEENLLLLEIENYNDIGETHFLGECGDPNPRIKFIKIMMSKHESN